jgi:hypothetical protein
MFPKTKLQKFKLAFTNLVKSYVAELKLRKEEKRKGNNGRKNTKD